MFILKKCTAGSAAMLHQSPFDPGGCDRPLSILFHNTALLLPCSFPALQNTSAKSQNVSSVFISCCTLWWEHIKVNVRDTSEEGQPVFVQKALASSATLARAGKKNLSPYAAGQSGAPRGNLTQKTNTYWSCNWKPHCWHRQKQT